MQEIGANQQRQQFSSSQSNGDGSSKLAKEQNDNKNQLFVSETDENSVKLASDSESVELSATLASASSEGESSATLASATPSCTVGLASAPSTSSASSGGSSSLSTYA